MVSDAQIVERLRGFLLQSDLSTPTIASVCRRLEEDFGIDLSQKHAFIREQVDLFLSELSDSEEGDADAEEEKFHNGPEAEKELKEEDEEGVSAESDNDDEEEVEDDNGKSRKKRK